MLVRRYGWIPPIALLNLLFLLFGLLLNDERGIPILIGVEMFVGMILIGLLFLPRIHLLRRGYDVVGKFMNATLTGAAGIGALSVLLLVMKGVGRLSNRLSSADASGKIDLSGFDFESLTSMLLGLSILAAAGAVLTALWYWCGIIRVLAGVYTAQLVLMTGVFVYAYSTVGSLNPMDHQRFPDGNVIRHDPHRNGSQWPAVVRPTMPLPPPPHASSEHLGLPADQVAMIVVLHRVQPDVSILGPIQESLVALASGNPHESRNVPGQWLLWIPYAGTMTELNDRVEANGLTVTRHVNDRGRVLVVHPK